MQKAYEPIRMLIREEVQHALEPFRKEVNQRFDDINNSLDTLYTRDQECEREYLVFNKKLSA